MLPCEQFMPLSNSQVCNLTLLMKTYIVLCNAVFVFCPSIFVDEFRVYSLRIEILQLLDTECVALLFVAANSETIHTLSRFIIK